MAYSRVGFDTDKYIKAQTAAIQERLDGKADCLVVEFGGKIIQDLHAARVLPGYHEDAKLELIRYLQSVGNSEIVFSVSGKDVLSGRIRGDFHTRYDAETLRSLDELSARGLVIKHVAITRLEPGWEDEPRLKELVDELYTRGISTYFFYEIQNYKTAENIAHDLEKNSFIRTNRPITLVISPGGGSGKFNVCLSQLYNLMKQGETPFYIKLETFPIHNLPAKHPLHLAFMAASADFFDQVVLDARHHSEAVSYNRDIENYEILHRLARLFPRESTLLRAISSATSMGINRVKEGIVDDEVVFQEASAEVARRFARYLFEEKRGEADEKTVERARQILKLLCENY